MKSSWLTKLARDQRGLSTMEYAVLFVIIVVGGLTLWTNLGAKLTTQMNNGTTKFNDTLEKGNNGSGEGNGSGTP